jgi:hypothetical protein
MGILSKLLLGSAWLLDFFIYPVIEKRREIMVIASNGREIETHAKEKGARLARRTAGIRLDKRCLLIAEFILTLPALPIIILFMITGFFDRFVDRI